MADADSMMADYYRARHAAGMPLLNRVRRVACTCLARGAPRATRTIASAAVCWRLARRAAARAIATGDSSCR
ncbi:hypothetical protein C6Q08_17850 [Burkholderia multivorans]|nr:hypothetical protein C6Q08_17850 [Burkholderia multivorans]